MLITEYGIFFVWDFYKNKRCSENEISCSLYHAFNKVPLGSYKYVINILHASSAKVMNDRVAGIRDRRTEFGWHSYYNLLLNSVQ
jgi:hypothetical protein